MNTILIIGCGDIGGRIAQHWLQRGAIVHTLNRQSSPSPYCDPTQHHCVDLDQPNIKGLLPTLNSIIYYLAPPPGHGDDDPRLANFLHSIAGDHPPQRLIYISTSGVYGDCKGAWIDETHPACPLTPRSQRRLAAEKSLLQWAQDRDIATVILRVGGIYGPGRLPLERLRKGMTILDRRLAPYSNRIHADDLVQACIAAANTNAQRALYNISDGHPTTMSDFFIRLAQMMDFPSPREIDWQAAAETFSAEMLSYLRESKRLDNRKMLGELGVTLRYPSLTEGLESLR